MFVCAKLKQVLKIENKTRIRPITGDVDRKITRHSYEVRMFNVSFQHVQKFRERYIPSIMIILQAFNYFSLCIIVIIIVAFNGFSLDPYNDLNFSICLPKLTQLIVTVLMSIRRVYIEYNVDLHVQSRFYFNYFILMYVTDRK